MRRDALAPTVVSVASAIYLVTLVVVPLAAPERDVLRSHPEHYADTALGPLVRLGYIALAAALCGIIAIAWSTRSRWRYATCSLALAGALTTIVLALAPIEVTGGPLLIGIVALALTPAAATMASAPTRPSGVRALGFIASIGFLAIALGPRDVAGLTNRIWDALLASWGVAFGWISRR